MPYLAITTNAIAAGEIADALVKAASEALASGTGKPGQYVMVNLRAAQPLLFDGSDAPAAFLEVKSIGFPADGVDTLARSLCELIAKHLKIPANRTYIVFGDVKASMWGHDGRTFG